MWSMKKFKYYIKDNPFVIVIILLVMFGLAVGYIGNEIYDININFNKPLSEVTFREFTIVLFLIMLITRGK